MKNTSRPMDGKPRSTAPFDDVFEDIMAELKNDGAANLVDFCVFYDRASLLGHFRAEIWHICRALEIKPLDSNGFRKLNALAMYAVLRDPGAGR